MAGCDATRLPEHREVASPLRVSSAGEQGVIPGVADHRCAIRAWTLGHDVVEPGVDTPRDPAESKRDVRHVQAEIAHHPELPARLGTPLPIDRLRAIDVRGVPEARAHIEHITEGAGRGIGPGALCPGIEGELAGHAHEGVRGIDGAHDALRRAQVDPEGLLAEEVASRRGGGDVDLLVQLMGNGDVEDIDVIILDEVPPVVRRQGDGVYAAKPLPRRWGGVGHGNDPGPCRVVDEEVPAAAHGCELAAHESATDDADPHVACRGHDACRISRAR